VGIARRFHEASDLWDWHVKREVALKYFDRTCSCLS